MNRRYQETTAIIFDSGIVPFWECVYKHDEMYGDIFYHNGESSVQFQPAIWDCKEEKLVSFFTIECLEEPKFKVGDKVVCTRTDDQFKEAIITEIESLTETGKLNIFVNYEDEKNTARLNGYTIPEYTKVILYKHKEYLYKVKGVEQDVHHLYLFKIKE